MLTPDGRSLDCSFFDSNRFISIQSASLNDDKTVSKEWENGKTETYARTKNMQIAAKYKKEAQAQGFTAEDIAHFMKHVEKTRARCEGMDIGKTTTSRVCSHMQSHTRTTTTTDARKHEQNEKAALNVLKTLNQKQFI